MADGARAEIGMAYTAERVRLDVAERDQRANAAAPLFRARWSESADLNVRLGYIEAFHRRNVRKASGE
jgi:hypothetical protein